MTGQCVTLWVGDALGSVERACLKSLLVQGHSVALYCYRKPGAVPSGVQVRDANEILAEHEVFFHRNGSVAIFADWFRYELQRRELGTWVDTDLYLLRPIDMSRPYLFGEEEPGLINNAVLRLPHDSALLGALLEIFDKKRLPSWMPWRFYLLSRAREFVSGRSDLCSWPFGSTGPFALTAAARRLDLMSEALPSEVFNPVRWQDAGWIRKPAVSIESVITDRTVGVHLWNQCIKDFKNDPAPQGSFLSRLQREGCD